MMTTLRLEDVAVGDKLAISNHRMNPSYTFCTATRITKQFVEVTNDAPNYEGKILLTKFSKATGKVLQGARWDKDRYLVTAEFARKAIERKQAGDAIRAERTEIKNQLAAIVNKSWTSETVDELHTLAERMKKWIEL